MINFRISNNARLPLKTSRGSQAKRLRMSQKLSDRLIKRLPPYKFTTFEELTEQVTELLKPNKINFEIIENTNPKVRGSIGYKHNISEKNENVINFEIDGYDIILPKTSDGYIDIYTAIHEFGHLFDKIHNPKFSSIKTIKSVFDKDLYKKILDIKSLFLPKSVKQAETDDSLIRKKLEEIPDEYAIDTLQEVRRSIKSEIRQYRNGIKYKIKNLDFEDILKEISLIKKLKFKHKLKLANKLLKERLKIARENIEK